MGEVIAGPSGMDSQLIDQDMEIGLEENSMEVEGMLVNCQ